MGSYNQVVVRIKREVFVSLMVVIMVKLIT